MRTCMSGIAIRTIWPALLQHSKLNASTSNERPIQILHHWRYCALMWEALSINLKNLKNCCCCVAQMQPLLQRQNSDIHHSELVPPSYAFLCKDRDDRGGGIAIAFKQHLSFHRETGIADHESAWCTIKVNDVTLWIDGVYRLPDAPDSYLVELYDFLHNCIN